MGARTTGLRESGLRIAPALCAVLFAVGVDAGTHGAEAPVQVDELSARAAEFLPSRVVVRLTPGAIGRSATSSRAQPQSAKLLNSHKHRRHVCSGDHHEKSKTRSRIHNGMALPVGVVVSMPC